MWALPGAQALTTSAGTAIAFWLGAVAITIGGYVAGATGIKDWSAAFLALAVLGLIAPLSMSFISEPPRREQGGAATATVRATVEFLGRRWLVVGSLSVGIAICFLAPYGQLAFMPVMFSRKYGWSAAELAVTYGTVGVLCGGFGSENATTELGDVQVILKNPPFAPQRIHHEREWDLEPLPKIRTPGPEE